MTRKKVSEAQARAGKKWDQANADRKRYIVKRSTAKSFIRECDLVDLEELEALIKQRREKNK